MSFKRTQIAYRAAVLLIDVLVIVGTFLLAYAIRKHMNEALAPDTPVSPFLSDGIASFSQHAWLLLLIIPLWEGALIWTRVFAPSRTAGFVDTAWTAVASVLVAAGVFGAVAFALQLTFMSRGVITLFILLSATAIALEKCALVAALRTAHRRNRNLIYVLIVGTGARAQEFVRDIRRHPGWGMRVIGLVDNEPRRVGTEVEGIRVIGRLADIPGILAENVVDLVAFLVPRRWLSDIEESIRHCEVQGVNVEVALDLFPHSIGRVRVAQQGRFPVLRLESTAVQTWQAASKRLLDVTVSGLLLVLLSPLFAVVAVAIKVTSPGPVFYKQARNGLRGREFQMWKFRSMVCDADARLETLRDQNQMSGAAFKIAEDPRVTPVGRMLRRFSLDELPQLINVFKGDMSLVGPRPLVASERDKYEEWQRRRMSVRPGLTCLWQINGRNDVDFEHWMELDLQYIDNWSLLMDLRILAKTLPAVIQGRGAY